MLVSVIIPCYNVQEYISECLDSVLSQTYTNIEIICVNNNSTDKTDEILQEYIKKHPFKIVVLQELKKGAPAARNKGLLFAKGEWIQFLDADDLLLENKIEHQLNTISNNKEINIVAGSFVKRNYEGSEQKIILTNMDSFKALFITRLGNTCANIFSRSAINEIEGWNEELKSSQESDLMFRLLKRNCNGVLFDSVPYTIIRERKSGQISQADPRINWIRYIELRSEILEYIILNKPEYFAKERAFYEQTFFLQLRRLSMFDQARAFDLFDKFFKKNFRPSVGILYNCLFRLLGFKKVEKLYRFFK
jgi:glycosyltransferase involved in cell wall biosynthesis